MVGKEDGFFCRQRTQQQRLGLVVAFQRPIEFSQVVEYGGGAEMFGAQRLFEDLSGTLVKRFGGGVFPLQPIQGAEVVEGAGKIGVVGVQHFLPNGKSAPKMRFGLVEFPLRQQHAAEIREAAGHLLVHRSKDFLVNCGGTLKEWLGFAVLRLLPVQGCQSGHGLCHVGMHRSVGRLLDGQRSHQKRLGLVEVPHGAVQVRQLLEAPSDIRVIRAEFALPQRQGLLQKRPSLVEQPEGTIHVPHRSHEPGLHNRLIGELVANLRRAQVQDLSGGDAVPERFAGVGDLKEADQKIRHLAGRLSFPGGLGLRPPRLNHSRAGQGEPHDETGGHQRSCGHTDLVAANELAQTVLGARGAGQDGLVPQVAQNVQPKPVGGFVAALAIFVHRLHDDPIEIAPQLTPQLGGVNAAQLGDEPDLVAQLVEAGTRCELLRVAQHEFGDERRHAHLAGIERQAAHEQLVEHDP